MLDIAHVSMLGYTSVCDRARECDTTVHACAYSRAHAPVAVHASSRLHEGQVAVIWAGGSLGLGRSCA